MSLTRSKKWMVQGGRSGTFNKTLDGRFVLKTVKEVEWKGFLVSSSLCPARHSLGGKTRCLSADYLSALAAAQDNAFQYFDHISRVFWTRVPSCLVKILGVYRMEFFDGREWNRKQNDKFVIVMENLFFERPSVSKIYDLKGSLRCGPHGS
jgi:hypothetical protein